MNDLFPGAIIQTRELGPARMVKQTRKGLLVALVDLGGMEIELNWHDLNLSEPVPHPDAPKNIPPSEQKTESDLSENIPETSTTVFVDKAMAGLSQRKAIEALRFGLVPAHSLEDLTLGYSDLRDWVLEGLPNAHDGTPRVSEVVGPFGTGKSHTMSVVRHLAREAGYLTARVEVDGVNISLSDPAKLFYSLWSTLGGRNWEPTTPLFDLFLKAIEEGNPEPRMLIDDAGVLVDSVSDLYATLKGLQRIGQAEVYRAELDALLSSSPEMTASELKNLLRHEHRLTFKEMQVKPMVGTANVRHPHDFALVLAGVARVARLAGFEGLVVTIDEFEVEYKHLTFQRVAKVRNIINFLGNYINGETNIREAPLGIFIATLGDDDLVSGLIEATGGQFHELSPWRPEDRSALAERIHQLYTDAYGMGADFDPALAEWVEQETCSSGYSDSGQLRAFIKLYVSKLDSLYGPPAVRVQR